MLFGQFYDCQKRRASKSDEPSDPLQFLNKIVYLGLSPGVAVVPEIEQRIPVADIQSITCGDSWRTTRTGRLLATTVGVSATATEKLGCERPVCKKYFTRGPCPPIAVEINKCRLRWSGRS
jgi:hypothetical protein